MVVLGLILAFATPFVVAATPRTITPDNLAKGYTIQQTVIQNQIDSLNVQSLRCHSFSTIGSRCALINEQIKSLTGDLHILEVSYNLLNASLEATTTQ